VRSQSSPKSLRRNALLEVGDRIPDARVWTTPQENATLTEIVADGPILLLFYLFDWSST
jgi:peroxiredoxin